MASGDFADCKLQLAYLSGRTSVSQLDVGDQALAGQCVNEAYLACYMNPDGVRESTFKRPRWAKQGYGVQLGAPITCTVSITQGSTQFTVTSGGPIPVNRVGSTVQIAGNYYRYAGTDGVNQFLVEPPMETTGSYTMTVWHNSYVLPATIIEIDEDPVVIGWGCLRPMNGQAEDFKWRQISYGDFWFPTPQGAGLISNINFPGGISAPVGDPLFYYINNVPYISTAAIASRFVVQPLPTQPRTITFDAWTIPKELTADADRPILPADLVTRVLFPIMRERWAMTYKKYSGSNLQMLMRQADDARAILTLASGGQRQRPVRTVATNC